MKPRLFSLLLCGILLLGMFPVHSSAAAKHPDLISPNSDFSSLSPLKAEQPDPVASARIPSLDPIPDVTQYQYQVVPLLSPFCYLLYVKTNNPDPTSFRLVDRDSVLYDENDTAYEDWLEPGTYYIDLYLHPDVVYEDPDICRVPGGYIFTASRYRYSDGGTFVLQQKTYTGSNLSYDQFEDTDVTVSCPAMTDRVGYIIAQTADPDKTFFELMDSAQSLLDEIAVYPTPFRDKNKPNPTHPYPFLAASPYPEVQLNAHYEMYQDASDRLLLTWAYPFVLDSLGFPGTLEDIAERLEPECEVADTGYHYQISVTFNGETHYYGGAGQGAHDPFYTDRVVPQFTFDGAETDLASNGTVAIYLEKLLEVKAIAAEDAAYYSDLIHGATFRSTIQNAGGAWIRIAVEGFGYGTSYGYMIASLSSVSPASNVWVDGRYVNKYERIELGVKFSDYPNSDIIVRQMTYEDQFGNTHTADVRYSYRSSTDTWSAENAYMAGHYYGNWEENVPDLFILTRAEAEAMQVDQKSDWLPDGGLIYDGTEYPGTPFEIIHPTALSMPESMTIYTRVPTRFTVELIPSNPTDPSLDWICSDPSVLSFVSTTRYGYASFTGKIPGTATLTAFTRDGRVSASCTITVLENPCGDTHTWDEGEIIQEPTCAEGKKCFTCTVCGMTKTVSVPPIEEHTWSNGIVQEEPTCLFSGYERGTCAVCGAVIYRDIPPLPHAWDEGSVTTPPTCVNPGVRTFTCTYCHTTKTESIPATGEHAWSQPTYLWFEDFSEVTASRVCTNGGGHTEKETVCTSSAVTKEATLTEEGEITFTAVFENPAFETQIKVVKTPRLVVSNPFVDVKKGKYYYEPVLWAYYHEPQITNGTDATHFSPNATCTRAQVVTFLYAAKGKPEADWENNPFKDVKKNKYYFKPVLWAYQNGITNGADATHFDPNGECTRAQVVTFLWGLSGKPEPAEEANPFKDVKKSNWYYKAVLWAYQNGITRGVDDTHFGPNQTCTRGQVVTFLYALLAKK